MLILLKRWKKQHHTYKIYWNFPHHRELRNLVEFSHSESPLALRCWTTRRDRFVINYDISARDHSIWWPEKFAVMARIESSNVTYLVWSLRHGRYQMLLEIPCRLVLSRRGDESLRNIHSNCCWWKVVHLSFPSLNRKSTEAITIMFEVTVV